MRQNERNLRALEMVLIRVFLSLHSTHRQYCRGCPMRYEDRQARMQQTQRVLNGLRFGRTNSFPSSASHILTVMSNDPDTISSCRPSKENATESIKLVLEFHFVHLTFKCKGNHENLRQFDCYQVRMVLT
jgi:hypothetical protein